MARRTQPFIMAIAVASGLAVFVIGCGKADPIASLPQQQADAVRSLEAVGAKVTVRDGNVTFVDFLGLVGVPDVAVHLKAFPSLEKINFSGSDISDDALVHLEGLTNLKEVGLNYTKISDKGVAHLVGLTKLERLNLNKDDVTDAGLEHLKHFPELLSLHLNATHVTDAGMKQLADCKKLKNLLAYNTKVTAAGAEEFRKTHPEADVAFSVGEQDKSTDDDGKSSAPAGK